MASDGIEIKELISGHTWSVAPTGRTVIKYSFLDVLPSIYQGLPAEKGYTNFNAFNPQERKVRNGVRVDFPVAGGLGRRLVCAFNLNARAFLGRY
jgi:hypothetical protein